MSRKNINRFSIGYEILHWVASFYHHLYYRKFTVKYRNKIPVNKPVIFAANHQNALMDALAIIFSTHKQVVFMARADIFRKKMVASLLYFLKILPVYRIRDGFHAVDQNKDVFKEVNEVLENNKTTALFPEGSHYGENRLRPFKKGAARLALQAGEANGFKLDVSIVPVGIYYSNYYHAGSELLVVFGDPISAAAYKDQYLQNQPMALNSLTEDLAREINKVVINIDTEVHYKTIRDALEMYGPVELKRQKLKSSLWNSFRVKKELSEKITENISEKETRLLTLKQELNSYHHDLKKHRLRDGQVAQPSVNIASLLMKFCIPLLLLPFHLYGMILNYLPYVIPVYMARKIKDPHFISSVRFVLGLLFFMIWYLLLIVFSFIIFNHFLLSLIFIISFPLTGLIAFYNYRYIQKLRADFRWIVMKYGKNEVFNGLIRERKEIIVKIQELINY